MFGLPVVNYSYAFYLRARLRVRPGIRHSLRPLTIEGRDFASLGRKACCGKVKVCPKETPSFRSDAERRTMVRNCTPENLEIPGLVRSLSSGRALLGPVRTIPERPKPFCLTFVQEKKGAGCLIRGERRAAQMNGE